MSDKQQSAVDFLVSNFEQAGIDYGFFKPIIDQANELFKQQIIDARVNGMIKGIEIGGTPINYNLHETHEQYFNETFKTESNGK